jgi:hypothetical protein
MIAPDGDAPAGTNGGAAPVQGHSANPEAVGIDQIRTLLFGGQMQDFDRRVSKQEERVLQRFRDIEAETTHSIGVLEAWSKSQLDSVATQLREEKELRVDNDQALEKRVNALADQLIHMQREIADRLAHEFQLVYEEIKRKQVELHDMIDAMFAELNSVKADRNLLSSLFVEVAKCLDRDAKVGEPGTEPSRPHSETP